MCNLSRNEVANEVSRVSTQKSTFKSVIRNLELLLGDYPAAELLAGNEMPTVKNNYRAGLPSEVIANNPSLQASWFSLMAKDAGLAFAHKQRFPSLSLTANIGTSSSDLGDLLSNDIGWSLIGNITQPIFKFWSIKSK